MSLASRKNSIIAWKMPLLALGNCSADLRQVAAHIGDGQHDAGDDHAERIEPAEERHDDRGEAVVLRKAQASSARTGPVPRRCRRAPPAPRDSRNTSQTVSLLARSRHAAPHWAPSRPPAPGSRTASATSANHITTAMISVSSTPRCTTVPGISIGSVWSAVTSAVCGKRKPVRILPRPGHHVVHQVDRHIGQHQARQRLVDVEARPAAAPEWRPRARRR